MALADPTVAGIVGRDVEFSDAASAEDRWETGPLSKRENIGAISSPLLVKALKAPCRCGSVDGFDSGSNDNFAPGARSPKGGRNVDTAPSFHDQP